MQQRSAKPGSSHTPLVRVISWISSISVLSSGMVWAQSQPLSEAATDTNAYETPNASNIAPEPAPAPAAVAPESIPVLEIPATVAPQPAPAAIVPKPASESQIPTVVAPQPAPTDVVADPVPVESYTPPASALPSLGTQPSVLPAPITPPEVAPAPLPATAQNQEPDYSNVYIDPTSYSIGATTTYEEPSSVVLSERSTGCETVLGSGQSPSGQACTVPSGVPAIPSLAQDPLKGSAGLPGFDPNSIPPLSVPYAPQQQLPQPVVVSEGTQPAVGSGTLAPSISTAQPGQRWVAPQRLPQYQPPQRPSAAATPLPVPVQPASYTQAPPPEEPPMVSVGPVNIGSNGISLGTSQPDLAQAYYNPLIRPLGLPGNGNTSLLFPLSIPAPITSAFGWRVHPISGSTQLHSGTDLGADMGTPVLAALDGTVSVADYLGGYGLAVVLEHSQGTQETLYAHLSQVFVKPGTQIKQGEVIGLVGSTGYSTGPHLHFELRQLTANGWITMDPGDQLEYALARLVQALETAQTTPKPEQTAQQKAG
jgi:biotin carboxyl carrier protein